VNDALASLDGEFDALYGAQGRGAVLHPCDPEHEQCRLHEVGRGQPREAGGSIMAAYPGRLVGSKVPALLQAPSTNSSMAVALAV